MLVSALYLAEINKLGTQLHLLLNTARKHKARQYPQSDLPLKGLSTEQIESARAVPLVQLFETDGNTLRRSGSNFLTHCPFHEEKTPSCVIYCETNRYYCFGCNAKGNSIDYLINRYKVSFREAVCTLIGESYE
jgi:hypothetical protein